MFKSLEKHYKKKILTKKIAKISTTLTSSHKIFGDILTIKYYVNHFKNGICFYKVVVSLTQKSNTKLLY